jgi:hypothetical protein
MKNIIPAFLKRLLAFIRFFKFELCVTMLMALSCIFWALLYITYDWLSPLTAFTIANCGWLISMISFGWILSLHSKNKLQLIKAKVEIFEECNSHMRRAQAALDRAYGYDEKLDKTVSIYSKLTKSVGSGTANALVNFALTTHLDDTVFLIRVNHGLETLHFQVTGRPIHLDQARAIMSASIAKIEAIAGPESLIQKKNLVQN